MKNPTKRLAILRWSARITGSLILAFILFMLLAHLFGNTESGSGFNGTKDIITFILFPISSVIGLSLALKWEGIGGFTTIIGMVALIIVRPDLLAAYLVLAPLVPGFLYAFYWVYAREINGHGTAA